MMMIIKYRNSNARRFICFIWVQLLISGCVFAQLKLPSFFSDNMVLQQQSNVPLWGKDAPGTEILIKSSWGAKASVKTDKNGKWRTTVNTPAAGGPFTIEIKGTGRVVLNNVMSGEVWLCSGQSNMQLTMRGGMNQPIENSNIAILESENANLRVFQTKLDVSLTPKDDVTGSWLSASPATVPAFSATAYFFGKLLQQSLKVPVGLIVSSYGGSSIEAWSDRDMLSAFPDIKIPAMIPETQKQIVPTVLYNAMLLPLVPYKIKGVLWYQGESNRNNAKQYEALFPAMIKSWRNYWQQQDLPFYYVQIAPFFYGNEKSNASAYLREAQMKTMQKVENTGMVVTLDVGDCFGIHPAKKKEVGDRLAYWALAKTYGIPNLACSGPIYKSMKVVNDNKINLFFDYAPLGFTSFGKRLTGFEICGSDKVFYPANAAIGNAKDEGKMAPVVTVWSDKVATPVAVRYAFQNCIPASLFNTEGLPASPFRTDDW